MIVKGRKDKKETEKRWKKRRRLSKRELRSQAAVVGREGSDFPVVPLDHATCSLALCNVDNDGDCESGSRQ
jgi:hypothetical protein